MFLLYSCSSEQFLFPVFEVTNLHSNIWMWPLVTQAICTRGTRNAIPVITPAIGKQAIWLNRVLKSLILLVRTMNCHSIFNFTFMSKLSWQISNSSQEQVYASVLLLNSWLTSKAITSDEYWEFTSAGYFETYYISDYHNFTCIFGQMWPQRVKALRCSGTSRTICLDVSKTTFIVEVIIND